jgi:hypothetical protein
MKRKSVDRRNSGQALIVSALVMAMLLLSTAYYVFEIQRNVSKSEVTADSDLKTIKLGTANTIISALANFTNGGQRDVLTLDLSRLSSAIENRSYDGQYHLQFTPLNMSPYQDGIWTSWENTGLGISSADANSAVDFSGPTATYYSEFETNVTTTLVLNGIYTNNGTEKTVNVTCTLYNENEPALANDIAIFYQNETNGPWTMADSSNSVHILDYGNGTYQMSFNVNTQSFLQVSANVHDSRDIFVIANTTCRGV